MAADDNSPLVTLENPDTGAPAELPAELRQDAAPPLAAETAPPAAAETPPPAADVPPPAAVAPATDEPDPDPEQEEDPRVRGILRDLVQARREARTNRQLADGARVLAEKLRERPDIVAQLVSGQPAPFAAPPPAAPGPPPPPATPPGPPVADLQALAESLSLYTTDGKPDLEAATRVHTHTASIARAAALEALSPFRQEMTNDRATGRRNEALAVAKQLGVEDGIAHQVIDGLMQTNPEVLADPQAATTAILLAVGLDAVRQKHGLPRVAAPSAPAPGAAAPPRPVFTETPGRPAPAPTLSSLERAMAKRAGVKEADWQKVVAPLANVKPGTNFHVMEEDE